MRAFMLLLIAACAFPTPRQQQQAYAESLRPAEVKPSESRAGIPLRTLRVRGYADDEYRQQTPRWKARIEQQVEHASAVLQRQFGVRLEVESVRPWNRSEHRDRLHEAAAELFALDPGAGVDWVVGFVSSLQVFTAAQEELGTACMFCRHFVVRGMFSAAETDAIDRALPLLSGAERETLARERRTHKETAVFLHEWAHTLGAFHERSPQSLLAPMYDVGQSSFSGTSARIIGLALDHRDAPASRPAWSKAYRAEVERAAGEAWDGATRAAALSAADLLAATTAEPPGQKQKLADADAALLQKVIALETTGDYGRAELALTPLVDRYPSSDEVQNLACTLAQRRGARLDAVLAACRRAAQLPDAPPHILLAAAHALLARSARADAAPLLARAEKMLGDHTEGWLYLAQLQFESGACSAAERAATHARAHRELDRVVKECTRVRRLVGFPRDAAALPVEREGDYVSAALSAHQSIEDRKLGEARSAAAAIRASFPGTPAGIVIECRAASRGTSLAAIKEACDAAAAQAPEAFYPQYVLGLVASLEHRWRDADAALQRAVDLYDSAPQVWQSLAAVKEKTGDVAALRALDQKFRARFKAPLRPVLWPAGWNARASR